MSPTAVRRCISKFAGDATKSFFLYEPTCFVDQHGTFSADVGLSLDVLFHLIEDKVFELYLRHLFAASQHFVLIYARDTAERPSTVGYVKDRRFTPWIEHHLPAWELQERIPNDHPFTGDVATGTDSEFFVYARRT